VKQGEMIAIIGPNGGGKSTLLKSILNQLIPMEGVIENTFKKTGYIPQLFNVNHSFPVSVGFFVSSALIRETGLFRTISKKRIEESLSAVKLDGFKNKYISTLSGGQFQRAQFARIYLQKPDLLLLDEPFSAIDQKTALELMDLLKEWNKEGKTIITVMHDLNMVREHFPSTIALAKEIIAYGNTEEVLTEDVLLKTFSLNMAINPNAEICHRN
jgi:zinc/manganese transport system ATP-binding protein